VIARFVDIGGIDDLHCSTFLFIMSCRRQKSNGHLKILQ